MPSLSHQRSTRSRGGNRLQSPSYCGQVARREILEMPQAVEQDIGRNPCPAGVETGAELLEELAFTQRPVGMALRPRHLLAFDDTPADQLDAHLVEHRGAGDLWVVIPV